MIITFAVLSTGGVLTNPFSSSSSSYCGCAAFVIVFQQQKQPQLPVPDVHKKRPTTWFIDGNNFLGQRGTPQKGEQLSERLRPITTQGADQVILVFDGRQGDKTRTDVTTQSGGTNGRDDDGSNLENADAPTTTMGTRSPRTVTSFRTVQLEEGMVADDFIMEEIHAIGRLGKNQRVKLVTADKRLRAMALTIRPTVKTVVNPVVFWRKYLPRMSGQKKKNKTTDDDQNNNN